MAKIAIGNNNVIKNDAKAKYKVKLTIYKGILEGNIVDPAIVLASGCSIGLDFSCPDNSQYIGVI